MTRLLGLLEMTLLNGTLVAWVDATLLCLGLTLTISSAFPALQSLRQAPVDRS